MRTPGLVIVIIAAGMSLGGCATKSATLTDAQVNYEAGQFKFAHAAASSVAAKSSGSERAEAAYLAGVSAYRMGEFGEAEQDFSVAIQSSDPVIVGRANATLGLMRRVENRTVSAAGHFKVAAEKLGGEEGAIAARRAAASYRDLGRSYQAEQMTKLAAMKSSDGSRDSSSTIPASDRPANEYTIQLGAFSKRTNAAIIANRVTTAATRMGIGPPSVNARTIRGHKLHVVRVGSFSSHADAEIARRRLGASDSVVAAVSD